MCTHHSRRAGFTMLEMSIAMVILIVLAAGLNQSVSGLKSLASTGTEREQLQQQLSKAMRAITEDLHRSSYVEIDDLEYPYTFVGGVAEGDFEVLHSHEPLVQTADENDSDFGPSREIVFRVPADADANGIPDLDANSLIVWDEGEVSFVANTDEQGVNWLERRVDGVLDRRLARGVERVVFETSEQSAFAIPMQAVRVTVFLRARGSDGDIHRASATTVVRLRN